MPLILLLEPHVELANITVGVLDSLPAEGEDVDPDSYQICATHDGRVRIQCLSRIKEYRVS